MVPVLQRKLNSVPQTFLMKSSLGNSDEINLIVALSVVAKPRGEHKETNKFKRNEIQQADYHQMTFHLDYSGQKNQNFLDHKPLKPWKYSC